MLEDFPVVTVVKETITGKWSGEGEQVPSAEGCRRTHRTILRVHVVSLVACNPNPGMLNRSSS